MKRFKRFVLFAFLCLSPLVLPRKEPAASPSSASPNYSCGKGSL